MIVSLQSVFAHSFSATMPSIAEMPWLKFAPLIAAFTITLCEALSRKTERRWLHRILVPSLSVIALVASCWIVWSDDKSSRELRSQSTTQMNRIEGKLGDEEATKRYVDGMNSLTRQLTATKTGNVVEKFFASQDERRRIRDQVNQANQKVLMNYEIRMAPVRDYVLSKFDSWINEIQKRGVKVELTSKECPSVVVGVRRSIEARTVKFQSGDKVQADFVAAGVQDGRLTEELLLRIIFNSANGTGADGMVFNAQVGENNYTINKTKPRFAYKEYTGKADNPIRDTDFIASLDEALDQGMAFVVEEATAQK